MAPPRAGPSAAPATPAAAHQRGATVVADQADEQSERPGDERRAAHTLHGSGGDQPREVGRVASGERGSGEQQAAAHGEGGAADPAQQGQAHQPGDGYRQCVGGEHPRHGRDGRFELEVQVGECECDHRCVGECKGHGGHHHGGGESVP